MGALQGREHEVAEFFNLTDMLRILAAGAAGALLGLERHLHGRAAGMRTNMLVAAASAVFMLVSEKYHIWMPAIDSSFIRVDPGRIAAGAITGVGFLGAGVIIKYRASVVGLTTAATIWMVSAIGLAFGAGAYDLALAGFALAVFALLVLDIIEKRVQQARYSVVQVVGKNAMEKESRIIETLQSHGILIKSREYRFTKDDGRQEIDLLVKYRDTLNLRDAAAALIGDPDILQVKVGRELSEE